MRLYIYSDESGVFDKAHYRYFCFGGLIIIDGKNREIWSRKYSAAEKSINSDNKYGSNELKAARISVKDKNKLFRTLNQCYKFGVIIDMSKLLDSLFESKKNKQRYIDYAYKTAVEQAIQDMAARKIIDLNEVESIHFNVDNHSAATNDVYELQQILEQEFIIGTFNYDFSRFYAPVLPKGKQVTVTFCDSASKLLIRAADIVANKINFCACNDKTEGLKSAMNLHLTYLPLAKELPNEQSVVE